jgi:hypothetical protein
MSRGEGHSIHASEEKKVSKIATLMSAATLMLLTAGPATADWNRQPVYSIIGAWEVVTTVRADRDDCTTAPLNPFPPNPFPQLYAFHLGGTVSETGARRPPSARSPGLGAWRRVDRDTFSARVKFQEFDGNGLLFRTMDAANEFTLSQGGNVLTGISRLTLTDISGNVLKVCATTEGKRLTP